MNNVKGLAITMLLLLSLAAAQNTTCEFPSDYVQKGELASLASKLGDDSASIRSMTEANTRKIDEMISKQYASSDEVQNISQGLNSSIYMTRMELTNQVETLSIQVNNRLFHLRLELMLLMLFSITISFMFGEWMNKRVYRDFQRRAGVYARRTPMTARERILQGKLDNIEKELEQMKPTYEQPSKLERAIPFFKVALAIALVMVVGILFLLWMGWF